MLWYPAFIGIITFLAWAGSELLWAAGLWKLNRNIRRREERER